MNPSMIRTLMSVLLSARLLHWQSKDYGEHVALGGFYDDADEMIDRLVEAYQGRRNGERVSMAGYPPFLFLTPNEMVSAFTTFLVSELPRAFEEHETDLLAIRDELLEATDRLRYLLTLK